MGVIRLKQSLFLSALVLGFVLVDAGTVCSQVLTWQQVQELDWSGPIKAKLKAATDGVFDEGPDYCYEDEDEWFNESDVVMDRPNFTISVYNNSHDDIDDLVFLLAYKNGTFSGISVGGWVSSPASFYDNEGDPFGPAGNRPGNGETALYNGAQGVVFVRVGTSVAARDTAEVPVVVMQGQGILLVHFDVYGLRVSKGGPGGGFEVPGRNNPGSSTALTNAKVVYMCASSHDLTWDTVCFPSATLEDTWSRVKRLFAF